MCYFCNEINSKAISNHRSLRENLSGLSVQRELPVNEEVSAVM